MPQSRFAPVLNTSLPHSFRYIRLERARDHNHPDGDKAISYTLIAPLDEKFKIDLEAWKANKEACRVVRQRPNADDYLGHLIHGPGNNWRFHYDVSRIDGDESGYHFSDHEFRPGEYLTIREADGPQVYRIVSVLPL